LAFNGLYGVISQEKGHFIKESCWDALQKENKKIVLAEIWRWAPGMITDEREI
jgi:hypothetical protein